MYYYYLDISMDVIRVILIIYFVVYECCLSEGDDGKIGVFVLFNGSILFDEMCVKMYFGDWVGLVGC